VSRVAQAAIAIAVSHGGAAHVTLTLDTHDGRLVLEVRDDGCGFDRPSLPRAALGLIAMEERAVGLGGTLRVLSASGVGTTVRLECPVEKHAAEAASPSAHAAG
jgi:signal transduction histidine kinase